MNHDLSGEERRGQKRENSRPGRPWAPADSIVSMRIRPSRQAPAPDTSSASTSPTLTASAPVGDEEIAYDLAML